MATFDIPTRTLVGEKGSLAVPEFDEVTFKLAMLIEGECSHLGPTKSAKKFGFTKQRYYQLLHEFEAKGARGLISKKKGPKSYYRRTAEVTRQIIRFRFLDHDASAEVIAQKIRQCGYRISTSSVKRVIAQFGLQKKTL